jgi:hypothetical protein
VPIVDLPPHCYKSLLLQPCQSILKNNPNSLHFSFLIFLFGEMEIKNKNSKKLLYVWEKLEFYMARERGRLRKD